jgi:putative sterol carrier protein
MASRTEEFFGELGRRGHEPLLAKASGTMRFEIGQGPDARLWSVSIRHGDIAVTPEIVKADTVLRADRDLFDRFASGQENMMAAILRGELSIEGNLPLAVLFQRLLPGPQDPPEQRLATADRRHRS